jgi:hypothetical protein
MTNIRRLKVYAAISHQKFNYFTVERNTHVMIINRGRGNKGVCKPLTRLQDIRVLLLLYRKNNYILKVILIVRNTVYGKIKKKICSHYPDTSRLHAA